MEKQAAATATGIPVNQAYPLMPGAPPPAGEGSWSTGLCDCFDDIPQCCLTCWCPCIPFGQMAEIIDKGSSSCGTSGALYALILAFTGCQYIYSCTYRTKLRQQYGIEGGSCGDCCTHFWCEPCALCQEHRELTVRGYDVALGWHGNLARQNQGAQMPPTAPGGMTR